MEHLIKFYPVENADCTLIKLNNGITIIVDCQLFDSLNDEDGNQIRYDVKKDLLKELGKDSNGYPYVDLFVSTHPHDDHCKGFEGNFYHGNPDDYDSKKNENEIIIGELWVTPRGIGNELADSAETIRQEAKRRRKLYDDNMKFTGDYGNHLRIIGYNKQTTFDERYGYVPGTLVTAIDGHEMAWLEMFIHAPFKEDVDKSKEDDNKNATSIVVQYSFKSKCDDGEVKTVCKLIMGGDAEHEIWQHIIDNNKDDENLTWNIFMAPHHCSWSFFNNPEKKDEVKPSAETIMQKQIGLNSCIIASSKEILDNGKNPPCYQARTEYKNRLKNKDNFFNTATDHVKGMVPQPIVFKIDKTYKTQFYNLDAIISVGYRVNSINATAFRRWATRVLKNYLLKGYSVNQQLLAMQRQFDSRLEEHSLRMTRIEDKQAAQQEQLDFFIRTSTPPAEMVFFEGDFYTARVALENLVRSASHRVIVIDAYVSALTLDILNVRKSGVEAIIYTVGVGQGMQRLMNEHDRLFPDAHIDIRKWSKESHDRWLVIDDTLYHCGHSLNANCGHKISAITRMGISPDDILSVVG